MSRGGEKPRLQNGQTTTKARRPRQTGGWIDWGSKWRLRKHIRRHRHLVKWNYPEENTTHIRVYIYIYIYIYILYIYIYMYIC